MHHWPLGLGGDVHKSVCILAYSIIWESIHSGSEGYMVRRFEDPAYLKARCLRRILSLDSFRHMMRARGIDALVNDCLIGPVITMGSLVSHSLRLPLLSRERRTSCSNILPS